jgi:superfamily II DNA/RNA helicase
VINFDPPEDNDTYTHRIGRTARAGRTGVGITFFGAEHADDLGKIAAKLELQREFGQSGFTARSGGSRNGGGSPRSGGGSRPKRNGNGRPKRRFEENSGGGGPRGKNRKRSGSTNGGGRSSGSVVASAGGGRRRGR